MTRQDHTFLNKIAVFSMLSLGILLVVASAFYISSFLTILGVSLAFWAIILFYINPKKQGQIDLLNSVADAITPNIERILSEYKITKKGIYLPPKNLQNIESSLIFIPKTTDERLPKPNQNNKNLLSQPVEGIFIDPPGSALIKLFEKQLHTSFVTIDLPKLKVILPRLFIEDFELAEKFEIQTHDTIINIKITKSIINHTYVQLQTHEQVGCLLSSTLACIIAKSTGKPVTLQTEDFNDLTKTMNITYYIREE